ncbi:translational GTPase TypA [Patescibacteria group bacterium]|nr:translational GTPase TypA [Patescibacteria group bacterium]
MNTKSVRNIAVIAHVDHGKTTLIDALLKQTHVFRDNQKEMQSERILDDNDQERERGITITAKNCAIEFSGVKINIIDTPGHADFSGEVERTLGMAEGALLIIDAQEGPMPQTRFVLRKAFELGLKPIVVVNKIDKKYARIPYVLNKTESLFLELATDESQLSYPILYAVGRTGKVWHEIPDNFEAPANVTPLLEKIVDYIPAPKIKTEKGFKMLISSFEYDPHLGRVIIGKIYQGSIHKGKKIILCQKPNQIHSVEKLYVSSGLEKVETESADSGDIIALAGVRDANIGETISEVGDSEALPGIKISEPTLHITVNFNTSPFSGREGKFTTSRQIEERLQKELERNLSLRVTKREDGKFEVAGRGELHLAVFLENLRREGYELEIEKPEVIIKEIDGVKMEPVEELSIIVPQEHVGVINQELGKRYATPVKTEPISEKEIEFIYHIPTRAIIGLRGLLMTATKGTVLFNSQVIDYKPIGKIISKMRSGVLIASKAGNALSYGLNAAQERGVTFINPGTAVYEGMVVGRNAKNEDIAVNVCKGKKLTNMRSNSSDGIIQLVPPVELSLEKSLDFIEADELLEITPTSLRLRKKQLSELDRRRFERKQKKQISQ